MKSISRDTDSRIVVSASLRLEATVLNLNELEEKGWTLVNGVSSGDELLALARVLGTPQPSPNGELIKDIKRVPEGEAPQGSQSSIYGPGRFPLHTDTVFWPMPVRYVLLRGYGDVRRPTTAMSFRELLQNSDDAFLEKAARSVWTVGSAAKGFYCSLKLSHCGVEVWRYDSDLMLPGNAAARDVSDALRSMVHNEDVHEIHWTGDVAAVLANWRVLHGRGPEPPDEGERTIERVYVR